jgi:hypothetical protein
MLRHLVRRSSHSLTKLPASVLRTFPRFRFPISWEALISQIQHQNQTTSPSSFSASSSRRSRLVVLDDDPTGCQTIYDLNVLLEYDTDSLVKQLRLDHPIFYILTNSRAMAEADAIQVTQLILHNLLEAKARLGYPYSFQFISRGDSTLRGHYPAEVDAIASAVMAEGEGKEERDVKESHATILIPSFHEGGRVTINSSHYLTEGKELIPVGMTPFAADPHFGYRYSDCSVSICLSLSLSHSLSISRSVSLSLLVSLDCDILGRPISSNG